MLILRRQASGYLLAVPLLVLQALLTPMLAAQTISQLSDGVSLAPGEIAGPLAGFLILAVAAIAVLVATARRCMNPRRRSDQHDAHDAPRAPQASPLPTAAICGTTPDRASSR